MTLPKAIYLGFIGIYLLLCLYATVDLITGHVVWYTILDALAVPLLVWLIIYTVKEENSFANSIQWERMVVASAGAVWLALLSILLWRAINLLVEFSPIPLFIIGLLSLLILLPWIETGQFGYRKLDKSR